MGVLNIICVAAFVACAAASGHDDYTCASYFSFQPDDYDCSRFIRCFWGKPVVFDCPKGTRWSQYKLTCDHAHNVACGDYQPAAHDDYMDAGHGDIAYPTPAAGYNDNAGGDYSMYLDGYNHGGAPMMTYGGYGGHDAGYGGNDAGYGGH